MFVRRKEKMSKTDRNAGYADACRSAVTIAKIAKTILPWLLVAVLSVSLVSIAIAAEEEFEGCSCHSDVIDDFTTSLHYTGTGMKDEYAKFAADKFGIDMDEYYAQWNCSNCHATTCEKCHGENPHEEDMSKNMSTCDQCHYKKQTSTFVGDILAHGKIPIEGTEVAHPADIHYEKGLTCTDCHTAEDMHGSGEAAASQLEAVTTSCKDCHNSPGKEVKGMAVTQFAPDTPSHEIHGDKLDCTACHLGWAPVCVDCHLDTRTGTHVMIDDFHLAIGADGKIKPFMNMTATYDSATHTGYGAWFPHTVTDKAKECADCHGNPEVLLSEGLEGDILGEGGSFIPQETVDKLAVEMPVATETPAATPAETPTETAEPPGFELIFAVIAITVVVYLAKRRR
jgi:hypothetical protein